MRESLFGSKESKETEKRRQEKIKQKLEEQSKKDAASKVEIKVDRHGREYEVAALVDVSINPDYIQSSNWDGLKRIGSERWVKESRDKGEPYMGFVHQACIRRTEANREQLHATKTSKIERRRMAQLTSSCHGGDLDFRESWAKV